MGDELNKPTWRPKFTSEFSMGELDFLRYNDWLKHLEHFSAIINSSALPSLDIVQGFFSALVNLYDSWRPIIAVQKITEELDNAIESAKNKKRMWENSIDSGIPFSKKNILYLVDLLNSIKRKILDIKQVIGLGIVVKRNLSVFEKIKIGIHGDKKFDNLPES